MPTPRALWWSWGAGGFVLERPSVRSRCLRSAVLPMCVYLCEREREGEREGERERGGYALVDKFQLFLVQRLIDELQLFLVQSLPGCDNFLVQALPG